MTLEAIEKRAALVAEIEARHVEVAPYRDNYEDETPSCAEDAQDWPCDTVQAIRALRSSNEELRKALGRVIETADVVRSNLPHGHHEWLKEHRPPCPMYPFDRAIFAARSLLADEPEAERPCGCGQERRPFCVQLHSIQWPER